MAASTPPLPSSQGLHKVFILYGSADDLGPQRRSPFNYYVDRLLKGLGDHPCRDIQLIPYYHASSVSVIPSYGNDDARILTDGTLAITGNSLDMAALNGYMYIIKMSDGFRKHDPSGGISFHLWHIAAGQHDYAEYPHFAALPAFWDRWTFIRNEIAARNINLSMILINRCLIFQQLFSAISPTRIQPWFKTYPLHMILLSGFVSPRGAVPFAVSPMHPALSGSIPSTIPGVTALDSPPNPPAHRTQHMTDDQRSGTSPIMKHMGSGVYTQVPATDPDPDSNSYLGPQGSSSATVQTQPYLPAAQRLAPMPLQVSPYGSGVEQRQPMPQDNTEALRVDAGGGHANVYAGPTAQKAWTRRLYWNGVYIHVRAQATEAAGDPKLSAWPKDLQFEFVSAPEISTVDVQRFLGETEAPVVRLTWMDETDQPHFYQLVGALGYSRGYAVAKWEDQGRTLERLLIAPIGKFLMCAAFPDAGIPRRPEHKPPPPVRQGPPIKKTEKAPLGPQADSMTTPTPLEEQAARNTMTPPPPRREQSSVACSPQDSTQGDPNLSSLWDPTGVFAQHHGMLPPQVQLVQRSRPSPTPTSPVGPYVEAAQRMATPPQSPVAYGTQDSTQGGPNPSSLWDLTGVFPQHQAAFALVGPVVATSRPVATPTSPEEPYFEAAQRMLTPPPPQSEQPPVTYGPQDPMQGNPDPSSYPGQEPRDVFSPAQLRLGQQSLSPDAVDSDRGLDEWRVGAGAADFGDFVYRMESGSFGGTSVASSESMESSEIDEFMDWDGGGTEA